MLFSLLESVLSHTFLLRIWGRRLGSWSIRTKEAAHTMCCGVKSTGDHFRELQPWLVTISHHFGFCKWRICSATFPLSLPTIRLPEKLPWSTIHTAVNSSYDSVWKGKQGEGNVKWWGWEKRLFCQQYMKTENQWSSNKEGLLVCLEMTKKVTLLSNLMSQDINGYKFWKQ